MAVTDAVVTEAPAAEPAGAGDGADGGRFAFAAAKARAYIALTKPRIIELLLVTTVPVMFLAERGLPSPWLVLVTLVAGTMSAGSANTINCYVDRDIDELMARTKRRPLVKATVTPVEALRFGIVLGVVSTLMFGFLVNWPSALLSVGAIAFYVFVYTLGLKRRTPSNIVIGGAAGCFPVLIGWSAVTGTVGWGAVILFAVVFFWTPPHFWALAIKFKDDYAAAGVPMLPVVAPLAVVARKILIYSYVMVGTSLLLFPVADAGYLYLAVAVLTGGWFLLEAHRMTRRIARGEQARPMRLFHYSITYLTLLFVAVAISPLI
ncbi:protoheme IX farnesyltransferase [Frankia sp. CNm7]|uniref:Protoheme IX farnesyltransferase n=1 Tax=Frankia nepalensis TaxID=1836974 RepID=A0A937RNT1_9ACTN|nr:protoheme IX farnesyltransferase [Frankia nepalensis]MBL7514829.1 protoheme IX farnesyltransferase [Frankia nepalensis]MBL7518709.1 protoheme IX farnesyltransferase [Frankia nepalensis]MBL7633560.1 protoheme IX farnesyltransferase [Frankia nepalensis]